MDKGQISSVFCSKALFNLSYKILTETEIKVRLIKLKVR